MKKYLIIFCSLIFLFGCATYSGPLTGRKYTSTILDLNHSKYNAYLQEVVVNNYLEKHPEISDQCREVISNILAE